MYRKVSRAEKYRAETVRAQVARAHKHRSSTARKCEALRRTRSGGTRSSGRALPDLNPAISALFCSPAATHSKPVNPFFFCTSSSISAAASVLFAEITTSFGRRRRGSMVPGDGTSSCWPQRVTGSTCPGRHSVPQGGSAECIYKSASQFIFRFLRNQEICVVSLLSRR